MTDELLTQLDERLARGRQAGDAAHGGRRPVARAPFAIQPPRTAGRASLIRDRWPVLEIFIATQLLWGALLFIPGAQSYRAVVRALPYVSSLLLLMLYWPKASTGLKSPASVPLLTGVLAVLALNLLHPTTQVAAGIAQCIFQLTIIAPAFWAWKAVHDTPRLTKLLELIFYLNALSAAIGILQVYFPDQFLPPQFSTVGLQLNAAWVESLSYTGADGRVIVRPPGLTDQPGGAAVAGAMAAILGLGLSMLPGTIRKRPILIGGAALGLAALYLTQVRSLVLMCIGAFAVMALIMFRRGRVATAAWVAGGGAALVLGSFLWAASVGGEQVQERFGSLAEKGAVQSFRENRGHFLSYTLGELLDEYPLGAGVGRWGMMYVYFGDPLDLASPPIYVEIQLTGWLLDGGILMWLFYGGALLVGVLSTLRVALHRTRNEVADLAAPVLAVQALIIGMSFAGPVFNTQMALMFWFIVSALHGVAHRQARAGVAR